MAAEYPARTETLGPSVLPEDLRERLVRLLRGLEAGSPDSGGDACAQCGRAGLHHSDDCELAACLRDLEGLG